MTDYHFVSTWRLQAPIEQVWEEIFHTEHWPSWWKYVHRVDQLNPGDADGLGKRQHLVFTTRLPYRLGFDIRVHHLQPPTTLEAVATGELEGVGRWTLTPDDGGTLVHYHWDVHTTRWWMNLAAPVARPAFTWNHDALMREAAQGLARRLDAELELPSSGPQPRPPARAILWRGLLVVLLVVVVVRWRRRAWPRLGALLHAVGGHPYDTTPVLAEARKDPKPCLDELSPGRRSAHRGRPVSIQAPTRRRWSTRMPSQGCPGRLIGVAGQLCCSLR